MNYLASITDFFKSPKWMQNLILAGLCAFIPIVGPMVVLGWLITGFWCRPNAGSEAFPDFDFSNFAKWLERGLWPMLVALVTSLVMYLVFLIPMFLLMALVGAGFSSGRGGGGLAGGVGILLIIAAEFLMMLVMRPLMLRATLTQDFARSFDVSYLRQFVSLMWVELVVSSIFLWFASIFLTMAGMLALCVGMFLVPGLIYFSMAHLDRQLYRLYLSRGGTPVPLSPKLGEVLPPMPAAT